MDVPTSPRGLTVDATDPQQLRKAIDIAFDYRGDITITLRGRPDPVEGYVFDRRAADTLEASVLRLIPKDGGERMTVPYAQIASLSITGRDTAAGRSWETWVRKYVEKKLAGEAANIEAEAL